MRPETCGMIDTTSRATHLPTSSRYTGTSFATACADVTAAGGRSKDWACCFLQETMPAAASRHADATAMYGTGLPRCPRSSLGSSPGPGPADSLRKGDSIERPPSPHQRPTRAMTPDSAPCPCSASLTDSGRAASNQSGGPLLPPRVSSKNRRTLPVMTTWPLRRVASRRYEPPSEKFAAPGRVHLTSHCRSTTRCLSRVGVAGAKNRASGLDAAREW